MSMDAPTETITVPVPETPKAKRAYRRLVKASGGNAAENIPAIPPKQDFNLYASVPKAKMVPVMLERHYRPKGEHEVLGYLQPEIKRKRPDGTFEIVQREEFIADANPETGVISPMPPPLAGVGTFSGKLWAGTKVRLPVDEAKFVRKEGIGAIEIDDD